MVRYSAEEVERSREAIRDAAATLFRRRGYTGVGIDELCRTAGLTRGTFYAHYPSKAALLDAVLNGAHDFVRRLKARSGNSTRVLRRQAGEIAAAYLAPKNKQGVIGGCSLASLAMDTTRAGPEAQAAYAKAVKNVVAEFQRAGEDGEALLPVDQARAALALSVGGLLISNACGEGQEGKAVARAATKAARDLLTTPEGRSPK